MIISGASKANRSTSLPYLNQDQQLTSQESIPKRAQYVGRSCRPKAAE